MGIFSKPFKDTATGKFLQSKGFDAILSAVGMFVPEVSVLQGVKNAVMGTPQYAALPQEDKDMFLKLHQMDLEAAQAETDAANNDTANARAREIALATSSNVPLMNKLMTPIICYATVGFTFFMWWYVLQAAIPADKQLLVGSILGSLSTVALGVFHYIIGSTTGSKAKDDTISTMAKQQNGS